MARAITRRNKYTAHLLAIGRYRFDHPDPSIFTVLTRPSETAGTANIDFCHLPRTLGCRGKYVRPPWYHMNIMSEFMGLIYRGL